jgi:hypothetical protein
MEDSLFTLVHYTSSDSNQDESRQKGYKQGAFLRAKFDPMFYNEHILFVKKLGS